MVENNMKLLTRAEELILLSVWKLKGDAYCIPIRAQLSEITGDNWSLGSIYMPLDRLVKKGCLKSQLSDSTPERGGRHKRIYELTDEGMKALLKVRQVQANMWRDIPESFKNV
jgi:PadR family transcriptional regulator PadR